MRCAVAGSFMSAGGRKSSRSTMPNMAAFPPIPSANVAITATAKPGFVRRPRTAYLRSCWRLSKIMYLGHCRGTKGCRALDDPEPNDWPSARMVRPDSDPEFMRGARTVTFVIAISCLCHANSAAQGPELARIDSAVKAEMVRQRIPGVAVAVVRGGAVLLAKGYGEANVEHHVPVTAQTVFQSGSVGKQFTSAAVMLLVEEGKLALTDSITKFFPNAPASWRDITVRHLLTHTSGIPDYTTDAMDYRRDYTEDELAQMAFGLTPEFPPGSRWNYSNTG